MTQISDLTSTNTVLANDEALIYSPSNAMTQRASMQIIADFVENYLKQKNGGELLLGDRELVGFLRSTSYIEALGGLRANTISESTANAGVNVDGLIIKDGSIGAGIPRVALGINSNGTIARGTGGTCTRVSAGLYTITFSTAVPANYVMHATPVTTNADVFISVSNVSSGTSVNIHTKVGINPTDCAFHFTLIY